MSILSEFKTGVVEIEIDGKKIPIKPLKEDKMNIIELQDMKDKGFTEERYNKQREVFKKILRQGIEASGDKTTDEEIDNFLTLYEDEFLLQLCVVFKWLTKDQIKHVKESLLDKISKKGVESNKKEQKNNSGKN